MQERKDYIRGKEQEEEHAKSKTEGIRQLFVTPVQGRRRNIENGKSPGAEKEKPFQADKAFQVDEGIPVIHQRMP